MLVSLFCNYLSTKPKKSILTAQPWVFQKTSISTTREPLTSNLTSRQAPTSNPLCTMLYGPIGQVSAE